MIKILVHLVLFGVIFLPKPSFCQDTISVPDARFKTSLLNATNKYGESYNIAETPDGRIVVPDISQINFLNLNKKNISDLTGLEAFTFLETLYCSDNLLTSLNVSNNRKLSYLRCSENQLTHLDLSNNDSLSILFCDQNQLQSIDVSQNSILKWLVVYNNQLSNLDVRSNPNIQYLYCYQNNLSSIDLSQNAALRWLLCNTNQLQSLDLEANLNLEFLYCHQNQLQTLDLSQNTKIEKLKCYANPLLYVLMPMDYYLTTLEKDESTALGELYSTLASITFPDNQTGFFELGATGAIVNITSTENNGLSDATLQGTTGFAPTVVGELPYEIGFLLPHKYWTINSSLTQSTYDLILDLSDFFIDHNFNSLFVLKRHNEFSPWENVTDIPNVSLEHSDPYVIIRNLTAFSDFAIGSSQEVPLPVDITTFKAQSDQNGIKLIWITVTETNNDGFIIKRDSLEIASYKTLESLKGQGSASSSKTYTYIDQNVFSETEYCYQLYSVDYSGQMHEYPGKVVINVPSNTSPSIKPIDYQLSQNYPNPFNPSTTITYSLKESGPIDLSIYDVLGRKVTTLINAIQEKGAYTLTVNAQNLASGIYIYRLTTQTFQKSRRMVVVK